MKNSVGNVLEILQRLDKNLYNGEQLQENYNALVAKWGEWQILGGEQAGLSIKYVDVGNALFSGLMFTFSILTAITLCLSIVLGKIVFPLLANFYKNSNEELVDIATLKSASQIDEMVNKKKKEWF